MSPFVQELVSFISLMLGVIVLTAWVMWLLLRPSGDTRVRDFSKESARDGMTQVMIENNELKNNITRLEREIKVLMNAGYGGAKGKEDEHKVIEDEAKTEDEGLKTQGDGHRPGINANTEGNHTKPAVVKETPGKAAEEVPQAVAKQVAAPAAGTSKQAAASTVNTGHKSATISGTTSAPRATPVQTTGEVATGAPPVAKETPTVNKQSAGSPVQTTVQPSSTSDSLARPSVKPVQKSDAVTEDARPVASKNAIVDKQTAGSPVNTTVQPSSTGDLPATPTVKPVQKSDAVASDAPQVAKETAAVNNQVMGSSARAAVKSAYTTDSISTPPARPAQKSDEGIYDESAAELKRLIEEAEKQKIAEYMASVEKEAERQKKEIETLAAKKEIAEKTRYPNNNLKRIKGIGSHLEVMLKKAGITSYQQIAEFTEQDIRRVSDEIGSFPRRIKREAWIKQARMLIGKG